jgi:hypothetical protein
MLLASGQCKAALHQAGDHAGCEKTVTEGCNHAEENPKLFVTHNPGASKEIF